MKKIRILLAALSSVFLATPALAQSAGGYVGAGFLSASTNNASDFATVVAGPGFSGDKSATGLKVYGGYLWGQYGVEAGYYGLGSYEVKSGGTKTDEFKTTAFTVSGVGSLPLDKAFNLHGKLGLAFTSADYTCVVACGGPIFVNTKKSGVSPLLGIGLGWQATNSFSLRADLELFNNVKHAAGIQSNDASYTALSVSGQYNF